MGKGTETEIVGNRLHAFRAFLQGKSRRLHTLLLPIFDRGLAKILAKETIEVRNANAGEFRQLTLVRHAPVVINLNVIERLAYTVVDLPHRRWIHSQ